MNIGAAAKASGLPPKTIRYYEEIGLVSPDRRENAYRDYSDEHIHKLRFIQRARSLGFSVEDCRQLLSLYEDKGRASAQVKELAQEHLEEIERNRLRPVARNTSAASYEVRVGPVDGHDVDGYRDYRGVQVVGAWAWLDEFNIGIVTETNLVSAFHDLCRDPANADALDATTEEAMHSLVVTMSPSDTVAEAIKNCQDWRIRHIPVLEDEDLVGIVSDRDIRMAVGRAMVADAAAQREGRVYVEDQRVGDIMSSEVITIEPTEMMSDAVPVMLQNRVSALPVSLEGMLMGIITRADILEHYGNVA